ncbi:MAG: UDP-N-acetylmuramoyl-tripeptide--D-alanyl-D-alanine ligase [Clostridia bacterium]
MRIEAMDLAGIINGSSVGLDNRMISGYSTDTRTLAQGDAFFAIPGEIHDGADHIQEAMDKGAACAVTQRATNIPGTIQVDDVVQAMGRLARHIRQTMDIPFIAITGSVGKTSVKDLVAGVLSRRLKVHSTEGNFNNHIGLPMTMFRLEQGHEVSVMEMGMNAPGEIDYLADLIHPHIGIITNIGTSHIGRLGSQENIFKAKTEMMVHLEQGGLLLVNGDDPWLSTLKKDPRFQVIFYGFHPDNDIRAENLGHDAAGCYFFTTMGLDIRLTVPGRQWVENVLPAIFLGKHFQVGDREIQEELASYAPGKMRMEMIQRAGYTIINDCYNASVQSMKPAIDALCLQPGRRIAVLGDMLEMGGYAKASHREIGVYLKEKGVDMLIACGELACYYIEGMGTGASEAFHDSMEAGLRLKDLVQPGDVVLLKGSRGMKMEKVLEYI